VAVSTTDQERYANQLGVSRAATHVLPLGVDTDVFTRSGPAANRTGRFRIVAEAARSADGVIDAVAVLEAVPDAELMVLIPVPRHAVDGVPHLVALRDAAEHAGVRDRVAFYHPSEDRERAWLLRSADAVVSVPLVAGAHRLVLEAMACGRPLVCTPVGAARDLVVHGVTGLHVTPGDGRALLGALRQLQSEPFAVEAMGSAGADRVLSRYAWDRVAAEFAGFWARCAQDPGVGAQRAPVDATA
jgi:glycosyltransferase involved in cell wall biosynthesis